MTKPESIRQQWRRYRAWQLDPTLGKEPSDRTVTHHCANCAIEFTGDFCYQCGQRADTGASLGTASAGTLWNYGD